MDSGPLLAPKTQFKSILWKDLCRGHEGHKDSYGKILALQKLTTPAQNCKANRTGKNTHTETHES